MMKHVKLGFIGCGKMATAIISGCLSSSVFSKDNVFASEINPDARKTAEEKFGIKVFDNNPEVINSADVIIFCVKPFVIKDVLKEISPFIKPNQVVISIVAGVKIQTIKEFLPSSTIIRVMPNTPAMVKAGISAICPDTSASQEEIELAKIIMGSVGEIVQTEEKYIDIITALSGSGPAFYYEMINDMAKSANKMGLDYETALKLSAQTAIGSGEMILKSGTDPLTLIKNVTTPGGCTAVGNEVLAHNNIEEILDEVIVKTAKKAKELG